jgi:hypothetical protein
MPKKPTKMLAKYATKCKYCNDKVEVGEIIKVYDDKWYHVSCHENVSNGRKDDITQKAEPGLKSLPKDPPVVSMFTKDKGILDGKPGTDADFHKEAAEKERQKEYKEEVDKNWFEATFGQKEENTKAIDVELYVNALRQQIEQFNSFLNKMSVLIIESRLEMKKIGERK